MEGHVVIPQNGGRRAGALDPEEEAVALLTNQLTLREKDVLTLLVEGVGSADIADRLAISPNTVRSHVQNVLTKLQVHSRLEAAAFAVRHDVVKRSNGASRPSALRS
ncbi:MAG: response regulator transcription factor [Actinobacteria bacterium]|nr:response regulator transcription factor [Actinomycetota bacterium]